MAEGTKGVAALVAACTVWGLSPLYYALLSHIPPLEVLGYRTLWSLIFFAAILALQGRLGLVFAAVATPRGFLIVAAAGTTIATNWFGFIYAIQSGLAVEASLGYYMFPLVAVVLGRVLFGETLRPTQWAAVALAGLAVAVLTAGLGVPPFIALLLAVSFGLYGVVKKHLALGPVVSVTAEVLVLAPLALAWVLTMGQALPGQGGGLADPLATHLLLALSGPLTALPLILFSYAARRVRLATVGLVQYLNPTLQFFVATLIFREPFTFWHAVAFPAIWAALALYSATALREERASRRRASSVATSGATET